MAGIFTRISGDSTIKGTSHNPVIGSGYQEVENEESRIKSHCRSL